MPKISVIMPAYNAEKYIGEAIDSILNQTYGDFEFIIIDDGSKDKTAEIVCSYNDSRIKFVQNEHNLGVADTLNKGIELAQGEYIARMDSDDISMPERFEKQIEFLTDNPDIAVLGTGIRCFGAQNTERIFSPSSEQLKVDLLFSSCFAHPTVMMRSSVIEENNYRYDSAYSKMEDYDLWCRISEKYKLGALLDILLKYRIHPNQVTQVFTQENINQISRLKNRQVSAMKIAEGARGYETYKNFCTGQMEKNPKNVADLCYFFRLLSRENKRLNIYTQRNLDATFKSVIKGSLRSLTLGQSAKAVTEILSFESARKRKALSYVLKDKIQIHKRKKKLNTKDKDKITIISNNCWGGFIYQKYGLKYKSPTVGLYILGHDFVKLASDWEHYFAQTLNFINWEDSTYYYAIKDTEPYPVARLDDIEIYFMHYSSEKDAAENWYKRVKRIDPEHMMFKLSQREGCSREDIETFMRLPLKNKVCFAYDDIEGTVNIPELRSLDGDETPVVEKHYDELEVLNKL